MAGSGLAADLLQTDEGPVEVTVHLLRTWLCV